MKNHTVFNKFLSAVFMVTFVSTVVIAPIGAPRAYAEKKDISYEDLTSGMNTWEDIAGIAGACAVGPATTGIVVPAISWMTGAIGNLFSYVSTDTTNLPADFEKTAATVAAAAATALAGATAVAGTGSLLTTVARVPTGNIVMEGMQDLMAADQAAQSSLNVMAQQAKIPKEAEAKSSYGFLDCIVYTAGQKMLNQLTDNIVRWIQGGFEGQPSYTVNTHEMFLELADMVAGDFARDLRGLAMCDFRVNFKNDLANTVELSSKRKYKFNGKAKCPFPETFNLNSSDFYKGVNKFSWGAMEYAMQENGNPFGIAMLTGEELAARSSEDKDVRKQELSWSNGFTNMVDTRFEKCNYPENTDLPHLVVLWEAEKASPGTLTPDEKDELGGITQATVSAWQKKYCPTTTPGKQIGDLLSKTTGVDMDRLGMVDNINKIVAALIDQVTKKAAMGIFCAIDGESDEGQPGCGKNPLPTQYVTVEDKTTETIAMENAALKPYFDAWQAEIKKEKDAKANLAKWEEQLLAAEMAIPVVQSDIDDLNALIAGEQAIIDAAPFKIAYAQAAYDAASSPERSVARQQELQAAQAEVDTATEAKKTAEYNAMIAEKNYYAALMTEVDAGVIADKKQAMNDANAVLAQAKATLSLANDRLYAAQHPAYVPPTE